MSDDRPQGSLTHYGKFQIAISQQRLTRPLRVWFWWGGIRDGGSDGAISGLIKSKMAVGDYFDKFKHKESLSLKRKINRFTLCS